jgi:hypothetical protein
LTIEEESEARVIAPSPLAGEGITKLATCSVG